MGTVIHCQIQGIHTSTTIVIRVLVGVCSRLSIGLASTIRPSKAFTNRGVKHIVSAVVHRQMQSVHAGATILIGIGISVSVGYGVGLASTIRPSIAFADGSIKHIVCTVVHCQMQGVHTGATFLVNISVSIGVGNGVGLASAV